MKLLVKVWWRSREGKWEGWLYCREGKTDVSGPFKNLKKYEKNGKKCENDELEPWDVVWWSMYERG